MGRPGLEISNELREYIILAHSFGASPHKIKYMLESQHINITLYAIKKLLLDNINNLYSYEKLRTITDAIVLEKNDDE